MWQGRAVPTLLDSYRIKYTFADAGTLDLVLNKVPTKMVLQYHGISTADFITVPGNLLPEDFATSKAQEPIKNNLLRRIITPSPNRPLFVRRALEGSSKGINSKSKVSNFSKLLTSSSFLRRLLLNQYIAVEEFQMAANPPSLRWELVTMLEFWESASMYKIKLEDFFNVCDDVEIDPRQDEEVRHACDVAFRADRAVGCRHLGRIDVRSMRVGPEAKPCVLEINVIADLQPGYSDLPRAAGREGVSYPEMIEYWCRRL